jgi:CubicO group peptidase (beta-lactamase class C family)
MLRHLGVLLTGLVASAGVAALENQAPSQTVPAARLSSDIQKTDAAFAAWAKPATPGCALGVLRDGTMLYSHGYGLADVEHSVPITPTTVFHVASVSKQFTALAIYILVNEGKLSLDDDIRKYLPELHDFHKTITLRNLLNHTSGLRDQWNLLAMAGWRLADEITQQDVLNLIWRQRELNFPPGEEQVYSNTGYTLLALIVERVSGKSLADFTRERIFLPLGMQHSHFHSHYGDLVQNRAYSYERQPDGRYRYVALSYSTVGPSSLFTTVEDLARWDENFYTGTVAGKAVLAQMQVPGKLNNGKETDYAAGLVAGEYRGLKTVEHGGGDAGFRTELLRFPEAHFSVITLCNTGDADAAALAHGVADIFLDSQLKPVAAESQELHPVEIKIDSTLLDAYVGYYQFGPGFILAITRESDRLFARLTGQQPARIFPASQRSFALKAADAELTFDEPAGSGESRGLTLHQGKVEHYARRIDSAHLTPERMRAYTGTFYSDELDTLYTVSSRDDKLFVRYPRGESELKPTTTDMFEAEMPFRTVTYRCSAERRCDAFTVTNGRVRRLRFDRVDLKPMTP